MQTDNVTPFRIIAGNKPAPTVTEDTVASLQKEVEGLSEEQFAIFQSIVEFTNFLLENKTNITHFVACVGVPSPDGNGVGYNVTTSPIDAGTFALSVCTLERALHANISS